MAGYANSAITIDYLDQRNNLQTESLITNDSEVDLIETGAGFTANIEFGRSNIKLSLNVELEEDRLSFTIPEESIEEGERAQLVSLRLYPFLGAADETIEEGYLFLPDGSGALIRFEEEARATTPFRAPIYGQDAAFERNRTSVSQLNEPLSIAYPVYGIVHGEKQNGFAAILGEGKHHADIIAYPKGASTDFYWTTASYTFRHEYYQPTSRSGDGFNTYQSERLTYSIEQELVFLQDDEASYVGMAHVYQTYLAKNDLLPTQEDEVRVNVEFLGGETKRRFFWRTIEAMTPVAKLESHVEDLHAAGVENMQVVYRGWMSGGLTGTLPQKNGFELALGSREELAQAQQRLADLNIPLYFQTDYTKAYDGASGFSGQNDVATRLNGEAALSSGYYWSYYLLTPEWALDAVEADLAMYEDNGVGRLAVDTTAAALYSHYTGNNVVQREEAVEHYQTLFEKLTDEVGPLALNQPNDYAWKYAESFQNIPLYSSNYTMVTDTVPFMQIVLKGHLPYFGEFSNFHNQTEQDLLRMIEYGAYPSFYLTTESSHLLFNTPSEDLFTSQFDTWKEDVVNQYLTAVDVLKPVEGETIVDRIVHGTGLVEVVYSNGKSVVVNYREADATINGLTLEALSAQTMDHTQLENQEQEEGEAES
ncbi:hypothetical protein JCM19045_3622 [Bacillus sp. JCM 19045]|nr:hypothetical protein JCM19045_3622 [Bacillus sp. JCM 19045]